ncbi:MAG TPA: serine hydrolase [Gemmatimonadaceae bacterium]|nr:serine hydrolase [Gemmatimonadaceae bacterium]
MLISLTLAALLTSGDGLPSRAPADVRMSMERLRAIDRVVKRGLDAGGFPGAAVVVGRDGYSVFEKGFGKLDWRGGSPAVRADRTIYDLASLTKVVATTTAAMILYDEGKLDLDAPVSRYLPDFAGGGKDRVTVRHLLTHRSGLPAGRQLWRLANTPSGARWAVIATPLACEPGACFVYSDLGADVLGWALEAIAGESLDAFVKRRVFEPLGMSDTYFNPPDSVHYRIAPTEIAPPRGYPLRGQVHDENAYVLGGVAGHAGLFSTAADLSVFAQMMLNGGEYDSVRIVSDSTVATFTRRAGGNYNGGSRALGWDTADGDGSSGIYLTPRAYGHTGFTGTSMWIDPDRNMFVILLTNRVHAAKAKRPGRVISDVRADLADAAAFAVTDAEFAIDDKVAYRADKRVGWNPIRRSRSARSSSRRGRTATTRVVRSKKASSKKPVVRSKSASAKKTTTTKRRAG